MNFLMDSKVGSFLFAVVLSLTLAFPADADREKVPDHAGHSPSVVGITTSRLLPTVLLVEPGGVFAWHNYSSWNAEIALASEVAKKMRCESRTPFVVRGDELVAHRIEDGGFATLCQLDPGEYDYRVTLTRKGEDQILLGKLVVSAE